MEKQLKFVSMLSLQEMALRKLAVLLWSDSDVLTFLFTYFQLWEFNSRYNTEYISKEWQEFEDKVKDKILKLKLPKIFLNKMPNLVELIGEDIRRWKMSSQEYFEDAREDCSPDLAQLCFTTVGTVDYKKSAEELVRWKKLTVDQRYAIACEYCLEDYIPLLWEELPAWEKWFYSSSKDFRPDRMLSFIWPRILKGESLPNRDVTSFNQWAFERSAKNGNKTAAEYFFLKLTHEERGASLMRTAHAVLGNPTEHYKSEKRPSDVLCYLLCLMTPEQQMETIQAHPVRVLLSLFYGPLQDLLAENAAFIWSFVPPSRYDSLLISLAYKCRNSSVYFLNGLKEFFNQSPLDFKTYFVDGVTNTGTTPASEFLRRIFDSADSRPIEVLFGSLDAADRLKLVFNTDVLRLFHQNILMQRWHMVEVCLREANLSKVDRERLKMKYLGCDFIRSDSWENGTFIRFLQFLDEADASASMGQKRKLENFSPDL